MLHCDARRKESQKIYIGAKMRNSETEHPTLEAFQMHTRSKLKAERYGYFCIVTLVQLVPV